MSAVEKVFFPTALAHHADPAQLGGARGHRRRSKRPCASSRSPLVMKGQRLEYLLKGLAVTPIRYALLAIGAVTIGRFATDLWITRNRKWRK